jgi:pilus assembly protein FimV
MSRRLTRISLLLAFFLSSDLWAVGLGDIHLDSALNEPLRAEIELLAATPEELSGLTVTLASPDTFERYGIDRPFYLQQLAFNVKSGPDGAVIQVRSASPITEPFLTFLVEATWSAGRLLREYTVLLDPPTYSPPAVQQPQTIEAPRRATPTDSARIERQQPVARPEPQPEPRPAYTPPSTPAPTYEEAPSVAPPTTAETVPSYEEAPSYEEPPIDEEAPSSEDAPTYDEEPGYEAPYSATEGSDYYVQRGDTLWGITTRLRPDTRLSMNQTMIAIYEANPQAFDGNINRLKAGVNLRIPSATTSGVARRRWLIPVTRTPSTTSQRRRIPVTMRPTRRIPALRRNPKRKRAWCSYRPTKSLPALLTTTRSSQRKRRRAKRKSSTGSPNSKRLTYRISSR